MPASAAPAVDTVTIEDHEVFRLHEPATGSIAHVVPSRGSNVTRFATRPAGDPKGGAVEVIAARPPSRHSRGCRRAGAPGCSSPTPAG